MKSPPGGTTSGPGLAPVCRGPHAHLLGWRAEPEQLQLRLMTEQVPCPGTGRWREPAGGRRLLPLAGGSDRPARPVAKRGEWMLLRGSNRPAISRTGWRPRQHQPGSASRRPARWTPVPRGASSIWWATSGSGPGTVIDGFEGVQGTSLYDDFSTPPSTASTHQGRSWISTGNEALKSSRYAFVATSSSIAGFPLPGLTPSGEPVIVNPMKPTRSSLSISTSSNGPSHFGSPTYAQTWPVLPASRAVAMSGRWTSAAPPAVPASNWLAASPTWTGSTTRPASSTWRWRSPARTASATRCRWGELVEY